MTETALPDVDVELLGRLMRQVEQGVHDQGWDNPGMHLYLIYDNRIDETDETMRKAMGTNPRIGPGIRLGPYTAQLMVQPIFFAMLPIPADHALFNFAMNIAYTSIEDIRKHNPELVDRYGDPMGVVRDTLQRPGVLAFAVIHEAWVRKGPEDEIKAIRDADWADMPGTVEARMMVAIDAHNRDFLVERYRGGKPELNQGVYEGGMAVGLRILMDAVTGRNPPLEDLYARYHPSDTSGGT